MQRRNKNWSRIRTLVRAIGTLPSMIDTHSKKAKGQLTKANQTKVKMENLARELQKVSSFTA